MKRRFKNEKIDQFPKKRVRFSDIEFDWKSLISNDDIEVDDEEINIQQMLKTSKVMTRDQITIREVIYETVPDISAQHDEFEEAEIVGTLNFRQITDLVATGRNMFQLFQNTGSVVMVTPDDNMQCDDYHAPIQDLNPLHDIEGCRSESEENIHHRDEDVEMGEGTVMDTIDVNNAARAAPNVDVFPTSLLTKLPLPKPKNKGRKRKHRVIDKVKQIPEFDLDSSDDIAALKPMRCSCVQPTHIMDGLEMKYFDKPTRGLKALKNRYMMDSESMLMGIKRVKQTQRKEEDDFNMVDDFFKSIGCQPMEVDFNHCPPPCSENSYNEPNFAHDYQPMDVPDETAPMLEPNHMLDSQPIIDPVPERIVYPEADNEPNLPSINRSQIIEPTSVTVPAKRAKPSVTRNCQLESEIIPRNVLRLLSQFVSFTNEKSSVDESQANLVLKNQQNKKNWGLIGVLTKLFRLWHHETYPVDMQALMYPHKEKIAAALAFYSVLDLYSPRIGLVRIEKHGNSNAVYDIHMSPEVVNLLQKKKKAEN